MKLLILTQKIDEQDPILGFFVRWVQEFAKHCEKVTVICLYEGKHSLPGNVSVLSLGKEKRSSRIKYLWRFYRYIWNERKNYDCVFVHMNPIYIVLGGIFWRAFGKKISLWYTHKTVDAKLRIAEKLSHIIFTASEKSFRLPSGKIQVVGHGIDTAAFLSDMARSAKKKDDKDDLSILSIGRISPVKNYEILIRALGTLRRRGILARVRIVGPADTKKEKKYLAFLHALAEGEGVRESVSFEREVPPASVSALLREADVFVNVSKTGSLDKAILEAVAAGVPVVTSNEAFAGILPEEFLCGKSPDDLARRIPLAAKKGLPREVRDYVVRHHDTMSLIPRLVSILSS